VADTRLAAGVTVNSFIDLLDGLSEGDPIAKTELSGRP
jgi:hypothetical protein